MKLEDLQKDWIKIYEKPLVIAGPCSAESEKQLLEIAEKLNPEYTQIFRAGIWKPRTKPGNFEGVGSIGLKWLQKVKEQFRLPIITEVANAEHVKQALDHGIDQVWIGARSTVNPFTIQEIAEALQNSSIPVWVKNPLNPDYQLWIGALERLLNMGITQIGAIHRGFSTYQKTQYRNNPQWQIALDFKQQFPNIPLLCDPSHIGGRRDLIHPLAQQAFNYKFDGLMVETHVRPDEAWSDAAQQITPDTLLQILKSIELRDFDKDDEKYHIQLEQLRSLIDDLDDQIWNLFEERMKVAQKIGALKKKHNIAIYQPERWKEINENTKKNKISEHLSEEFVERIMKAIHQQSLDVQNGIINNP